MKRSLYLILILLAASYYFQGCESDTSKEAIEYNDSIIKEQDKIVNAIIEISKSLETRNPAVMEQKLLDLQKQIELSLSKVNGMESFEDNNSFKEAAIVLFKFYKKVAYRELKEKVMILSKPIDELSQADIQRVQEINNYLGLSSAPYEDEFSRRQAEFAREFKIQIRENVLQREIDRRPK